MLNVFNDGLCKVVLGVVNDEVLVWDSFGVACVVEMFGVYVDWKPVGSSVSHLIHLIKAHRSRPLQLLVFISVEDYSLSLVKHLVGILISLHSVLLEIEQAISVGLVWLTTFSDALELLAMLCIFLGKVS